MPAGQVGPVQAGWAAPALQGAGHGAQGRAGIRAAAHCQGQCLVGTTPEQVQSVAERYFGDDQLTVGTLVPPPLDSKAARRKPSGVVPTRH